MQTGVILQVEMRKRGKYGLTVVFNTNKIGGFRPFILVSTDLLTAASCCPGSTGSQHVQLPVLLVRSVRIQTPKTPEKHHPTQKGGGPLGSYPAPAGNIYYNQSRWSGVMQYKNGVFHKYFPNSIGKLLVMCYKLFKDTSPVR
jgi:hypothetical protein